MSNSSQSSSKDIFTEGIYIALATAFVYVAAFLYEYGYCYHFDIPVNLISPDIDTVLVSATSIGILIFTSLIYLAYAVPFIRASINPNKTQEPFSNLYAIAALLLIYEILIIRAYGWSSYEIYIMPIVFLILVFIYGMPMLFQKNKKTFVEKLEAVNSQPDKTNIWSLVREIIGEKREKLLWMSLIILSWFFLAGNGAASSQEKYLVMKEPAEHVLLRNYGNLMIAASVDKETKLVGHEFVIINILENNRIEFLSERIGPLKLAPYVTTEAKEIKALVPQTQNKPSSIIEEEITQNIQSSFNKTNPSVPQAHKEPSSTIENNLTRETKNIEKETNQRFAPKIDQEVQSLSGEAL